jgi:hypothetical protein
MWGMETLWRLVGVIIEFLVFRALLMFNFLPFPVLINKRRQRQGERKHRKKWTVERVRKEREVSNECE